MPQVTQRGGGEPQPGTSSLCTQPLGTKEAAGTVGEGGKWGVRDKAGPQRNHSQLKELCKGWVRRRH